MADETDFVLNLKYENELPRIPCGPFFREVGLAASVSDFLTYRTSSLERSYVWKPHLGPFVGIKLDLVDQDSFLSTTENGVLDPSESKYINERRVTGRAGIEEKPAWMRKTSLLDNKIFASRNQNKSKPSSYKKADIGKYDPFSSSAVGKSFEEVQQTIKKLTSDKVSIEWISPIFPDDEMWSNNLALGIIDETVDSNAVTEEEASVKCPSAKSIITNIRNSQNAKTGALSYSISLVAPEKGAELETSEELYYPWVRDFKMDLDEVKDAFVIKLDEKVSKYCPLRKKLILKRINADESDIHHAKVRRRSLTEEEKDSQALLREIQEP